MGEIVLGIFGLYLIFQVVIGYRRGLMRSMLNLASWILTFAIAYEGASYFKDIVIQNVFINKISRIPGVGFINRVAGAVLGLIKGSLIIMVLMFFISLMPHIGMQTEYDQIIGGSELMQTMVDTNPLGEMIQQQVRSETEKILQN